MDYLTDSADFTFNGKKRRMGVAIDNGHIIAFPRKGSLLDDLAVSVAVLAGIAVPIVAIPVALAVLGVDKAINRPQQEELARTIDMLQRKFKLAESDLLIANNETSSVTLSGNSFLTFGNTTVKIAGRFATGDKVAETEFSCAFNSGKAGLQRLFERNGYKVQIY
ncbi:hypothetical protein P8R33_03840 [Qipengyuania sp. XHP0211]|uniref:hypothetical protein n=1 Tax=Qipengyuania sp. XHP0211 TaxID=3038079 RepID=UPI00241F2A86|nr:hypothetical protein [Qipengyuania sp. XHP0211]MDG5750231.1 hypothetical protein [Qipengyuania sp. XHP0211]